MTRNVEKTDERENSIITCKFIKLNLLCSAGHIKLANNGRGNGEKGNPCLMKPMKSKIEHYY